MTKNIILCGVGGQGTVLASRLISTCAMKKGWQVMSAETIGMAQRGGSVFSHLRLSDPDQPEADRPAGPMIAPGTADLILGFEPGETVRMLPYLKQGGQVVVSSRAVQPVTATLAGSSYRAVDMIDFLKAHVSSLVVVDADRALAEVGSAKVLNLILLGAAAEEDALGFSYEELRDAIREKIHSRFHELNFKALSWYGQSLQ